MLTSSQFEIDVYFFLFLLTEMLSLSSELTLYRINTTLLKSWKWIFCFRYDSLLTPYDCKCVSAYLCLVNICIYIYIYIYFVFVDFEGSVLCVAQTERMKIEWMVKNILGFSEQENSYHLSVNLDSVFKSWRWKQNFCPGSSTYPAQMRMLRPRRYGPNPKVKYCLHMFATLSHILWKSTSSKSLFKINFNIILPFMHKCFVWSFPIKFSKYFLCLIGVLFLYLITLNLTYEWKV
jgi:hypothetical protein